MMFSVKRVERVPEDAFASNPDAATLTALQVDCGLAAWTTLQKVRQKLITKKVRIF